MKPLLVYRNFVGGEARTIYLTPLGINIALTSGYAITRHH